jgi:hypothetical protein
MNRPEYNDNNLPIDEALYERMREHGERVFVYVFFVSPALIGHARRNR